MSESEMLRASSRSSSDVAVDFRRDRVYLPQDELAQFGCTEGDIRLEIERAGHGVKSRAVRHLLTYQAERAHEYFARAERARPRKNARRLVAAEIMRAVYYDLLRKIEAAAMKGQAASVMPKSEIISHLDPFGRFGKADVLGEMFPRFTAKEFGDVLNRAGVGRTHTHTLDTWAETVTRMPVGSTEAEGSEECTRWPDGRRMQ